MPVVCFVEDLIPSDGPPALHCRTDPNAVRGVPRDGHMELELHVA
jgi:hypothetical protein